MLKKTSSREKELPINGALTKFSKFLEPKYGIIKSINKLPEYFDDPKFYHFSANLYPLIWNSKNDKLSDSVGGYSFFSEEEALLKCIGEALERYCIREYDENILVRSSYKSLIKKAVNPKEFINFSELQKKRASFTIFNYYDETPFRWVKSKELISNEEVFVPAQLIYLYYKLIRNEKWIYLPISTGTAGGSTKTSSIVRAIYELIERDAFLIFYLNRLPGININLNYINDKKVQFCREKIESYNLKLYCIDITTELRVPTIISIVIDKTGIGPAVSAGLKTSYNTREAIVGSIQEALHPRGWIRRHVDQNPTLIKNPKKNSYLYFRRQSFIVVWC